MMVVWTFLVSGAVVGLGFATAQAAAETTRDQYDAEEGAVPLGPASPAADTDPEMSATASASATPPPSTPPVTSAKPSVPASASASASASVPAAPAPDDTVEPSDTGGQTVTASASASPPVNSAPPEPVHAPSSPPALPSPGSTASASASASAEAPDGGLRPASGTAVENERDTYEDQPPQTIPKAGGPWEPEIHYPPAPYKDYQHVPCSDEEGTCGFEVPEGYACEQVYEGEARKDPSHYECAPEGEQVIVEGPKGQECSERLHFDGLEDRDPEVIYACERDPKTGYTCDYVEGWEALSCERPKRSEFEGSIPPWRSCGANDCDLSVPETYSCTRMGNKVKSHYRCRSPRGHGVTSPDGDQCRKILIFDESGGRRSVRYFCRSASPDMPGVYQHCGYYDSNWKPVPCVPGGAAGAGNAPKPSEDAQHAIKENRERPFAGWTSAGRHARHALGFGDGSSGGPTVSFGSVGSILRMLFGEERDGDAGDQAVAGLAVGGRAEPAGGVAASDRSTGLAGTESSATPGREKERPSAVAPGGSSTSGVVTADGARGGVEEGGRSGPARVGSPEGALVTGLLVDGWKVGSGGADGGGGKPLVSVSGASAPVPSGNAGSATASGNYARQRFEPEGEEGGAVLSVSGTAEERPPATASGVRDKDGPAWLWAGVAALGVCASVASVRRVGLFGFTRRDG